MPIDNPLEAASGQIAADERQRNPISDAIVHVLSQYLPAGFIIRDFVEKHREENRELLLKVLLSETRSLQIKFERLSKEHRQFLQFDFPGLLMDALKKAETVRAHDRVERIAHILGNAAELGPLLPPDDIEEMLRIAVQLSDMEVSILATLVETQASVARLGGMPKAVEVTLAWIPDPFENADKNLLYSACLKLQSLGLVVSVRTVKSGATNLGLQEHISSEFPVFGVLQRGSDFIRYARKQNPT